MTELPQRGDARRAIAAEPCHSSVTFLLRNRQIFDLARRHRIPLIVLPDRTIRCSRWIRPLAGGRSLFL